MAHMVGPHILSKDDLLNNLLHAYGWHDDDMGLYGMITVIINT
jgi:hypothetical protein